METRYSYDADGRLIETDQETARSAGSWWQTSYRYYDALGRLTQGAGGLAWDSSFRNQDASAQAWSQVALDSGGRVTDRWSAGMGSAGAAIRTHYEYDDLSRQISVTGNADAALSTPAVTGSSIYDPRGAETAISPPTQQQSSGVALRSEVDLLGGSIARINNDLQGTSPATDVKVVTSTAYDGFGRVVDTYDELGVDTRRGYDALDRVSSVTVDRGISPHLNLTTSYSYDLAGNRNLVTTYGYDPDGHRLTITNALGHTTTTQVDGLGRVLKVSDASGYSIQTQYSQAGEVVQRTDARGLTNLRTLDRLGRTLNLSYVQVAGTRASLVFAYDASGEVTGFQDSGGSGVQTTLAYDNLGRTSQVATGSCTTAYIYYLDGAVKSVTDATGTTAFSEDALGRLSQTLDPLNGAASPTLYTVDVLGRLGKRQEGVGVTSTFAYSGVDRQLAKSVAVGTASPFASWTSQYDANGNLTQDSIVLPGDTLAGTTAFGYDTLDQVQSVSIPTQAAANYTYDAAHNLGGFTYQANESLTTTDPDGNQTTDSAGHKLEYDSLNRLADVRDSANNLLVVYLYDAMGRLEKRTQGSATTQFVYRGAEDKVLQELDGTGALIRAYAWDTSGRMLAVRVSGSNYFPLTNPHGDIMGLATGSGSVAGWVHYNAWGKTLASGGTQVPFGFQSGWTDPTTGLVKMGARWYDTTEGRFASSDPAAASANPTTPLDSHRWVYGRDNPTGYVDPTGLYSIPIPMPRVTPMPFPGLPGLSGLAAGARAIGTAIGTVAAGITAGELALAAVLAVAAIAVQAIFSPEVTSYDPCDRITGPCWGGGNPPGSSKPAQGDLAPGSTAGGSGLIQRAGAAAAGAVAAWITLNPLQGTKTPSLSIEWPAIANAQPGVSAPPVSLPPPTSNMARGCASGALQSLAMDAAGGGLGTNSIGGAVIGCMSAVSEEVRTNPIPGEGAGGPGRPGSGSGGVRGPPGGKLGIPGGSRDPGSPVSEGGGDGRIALGLGEHLDSFAAEHGATTWKQWADPVNWRPDFTRVMSDERNQVFFNLKDVDVGPGITRAAAGRGGATDWELLQIRQNSQWWSRITWKNGRDVVGNPFA